MIALFSVLLALSSLVYLVYPNDFVLVALALLSLIGWKICGRQINAINAFLFAFYLFVSSIALYGRLLVYSQLGAIAYTFLVSAALVAVAQYLVEKNDT